MTKRALIATLCGVLFLLFARPVRAGGTLLLAHEPAATELPLKRTDVALDVAGSIVEATVTQQFKNPYDRPIEVTYLFPLSQRAAVDAMEMKIGNRTITGSIAKRADAQRAYAQAIAEGRRAAMLEEERPNLFTFSVGNIDAGATIEVKVHYFEMAHFDHGTYEVVVPTTLGPRFNPPSVTDAARIKTEYIVSGPPIGIHAKLDAGAALEDVSVPAWETKIARPTVSTADIQLKTEALPDRDFVLRWRLHADSFQSTIFTHRAANADAGYLSLMLEPKHDIAIGDIAPRELVFLIDTSGSMHGAPLSAARLAIDQAIDKLGARDTFQIIDFADTASTFAPTPLPNSANNRKKGHEYLAHLRSGGGTNQLVGIHAALSAAGDASRTRYVVFMTDGFIGNDADVIALTQKEIGKAHIYSFGVGSNVNRALLDEVARAGRGEAEYMRPTENPQDFVDRFYDRIGLPYLTDIEIDWGHLAGAVTDITPSKLPDLSALSPLVVQARYLKAAEGDVVIRGRVGGKLRTQQVHVKLPNVDPAHAAIEKIWARETLADLERAKSQPVELSDFAVAHGILSKYTAFIGTDSTGPGNGAPLRIHQPNEAPADLNLEMAGGQYANATTAAFAESDRPEMASMEVRHGGGCAGCTTAPSPMNRGALTSLIALLLTLLARRRRREQS